MTELIQGRVWKTGDNVTAYQIIDRKRWTVNGIDPDEMGKWVFEGAMPEVEDIPFGFKNKGYTVVIAGEDFGGGGKSIEHPVVAMQGAGIRLVVAESFARYTYRNAINLGLPALTCTGITDMFSTGDEILVNLLTGRIDNLTTGATCCVPPLPEDIMNVLSEGGLLNYYRKALAQGT